MRKTGTIFSLLTYKILQDYLIMFFIGSVVYVVMLSLLIYGVMLEINKTETKRLSVYLSKEYSLEKLCDIVSCHQIEIELDEETLTYNNEYGELVFGTLPINKELVFSNINSDMMTVIEYGNKTFVIDHSAVIKYIIIISFLYYALISFIFTVLYVIARLYIKKSSIIDNRVYRDNIESKLQRDIAESAKHEMAIPLAIIKSELDSMFRELFPCKQTANQICNVMTEGDMRKAKCKVCLEKRKNNPLKDLLPHYHNAYNACMSIDAVLNIISNAKHIKYNNGTVSLYAIIENAVNTVATYAYKSGQYIIENEELLKNYSVGYGLTNGDMLNCFRVLAINAIEAKASQVTFKFEVYDDDYGALYVIDNGCGIRNKDGKIHDHVDMIFKYGYSTKSTSRKIGWWIRLLNTYNLSLDHEASTRGVGLYIYKEVLKRVGGDINVESTNENGTVFKLILPIKKRRVID